MNFEITVGKKINSKLLYCEKQLYSRKSVEKNIEYYECYLNCGVRIKVQNGICTYVKDENSFHTHGDQEVTYHKFKAENNMKVRCYTEKKRPRDIFDEECSANQEAGSSMQYAKRYRSLKYHQNKGIPQNPKTIEDVKLYFETDEILRKFAMTLNMKEPKKFYHETVINPNFAYVLFSSEAILCDIPTDLKIRIDRTFKTVPKGPFKQLIIISADLYNHSFPCFFVLMTRKTQTAYTHLLQKIDDNWKIKPTVATSDFEKAIKNALKKKYPGIHLISCWFHFTQAVQKKARKCKGFVKFIKTNDSARRAYHKFLCLPLMRSQNIPESFKLLKAESISINKTKFNELLKYIEQQWLIREGPGSISVFKQQQRTNNPMESYNSRIGAKIQSNGCFYEFLGKIQTEELIKSQEYKIVNSGGNKIYHSQPKKQRERNEFISDIQDKFEKGKISIEHFSNKAADMYDADPNEKYDSDDEDVDSDDEDEDDEVFIENCAACGIRRKSTMFLPCNHVQFCEECLSENVHVCPVCDEPIEGHLRIFLW